ncbi:MAG: hypothetical protein HY897_03970 [Deltaproteobacteria bacterium]|nr:hypothetical protein [Deltaproteobacteria bacterium]
MKRYIRLSPSGETESMETFELFRLALSTRARNLLGRLNLRTVADLRGIGLQNIRDMKGCGRKTYHEITEEIDKLQTMGPERYVAHARAGGDDRERRGPIFDTGAALHLLVGELARSGYINSSQAQRMLGLDSFAVRPLLRLLVEKGLATKEGRRRGMRYVRTMR